VEIETATGDVLTLDSHLLQDLDRFAEDDLGIPVERVLWQAGHRVIAEVTVLGPEGERRVFDWPAVAEDAWWQGDGRVSIGGETLAVSRLEVEPSPLLAQVRADITDIAPTAAAALGLPAPAEATGRSLESVSAEHVLLLFLDGFGAVRYGEALEAGLVPNLAALGEPLMALTAYPPCTRVGTAALLTGAPPEVSGVDQRDIRATDSETLFDVAAEAGLSVMSVEGESLAFNLRNTDVQLSGDRDANDSTDDNVLGNALAVLAGGMPDLFYVHFHGIDDAGHEHGPGAPEEAAVISDEDRAVGQIVEALPDGTLVIIFADHGMHDVDEEGRLGNHASLIERDMLIPIFVVQK
jgi:hypothetical protein